jgi:pimeloyl-ACP methyl ester carboxylesterase
VSLVILLYLVVAVLLLCGGMALIVLLLEWRHVFRPSRELPGDPSDVGLVFEDLTFVAEDGRRLHGWWIPADKARVAVLFCHGNTGNIGTHVDTLQVLHEMGAHVLAFDYRGYGQSKGVPSERGIRKDARAAYEMVRARFQDADTPPVVVYGRSLGGAIAMHLASERPVLGVVVESAFSSILDMAAHLYPWAPYRWFGRYRFDTARAGAKVTAPKLIAHSGDDELIPLALGRRIYDMAADPKQFHELRGSHGEPGWVSNGEYRQALESFVRRAAASVQG